MIVESVLKAFNIQGAIDKVAPFGLGHINDSYQIRLDNQTYFLQKINTGIFTKPEALEYNLRLLLTVDSSIFVTHYQAHGHYHWQHENELWRLTDFKEGCYSPQMPEVLAELAQVAKGFGAFARATFSLEQANFSEPISRFHDLTLRWEQLNEALQHASSNRLEKASEYIAAAKNHYPALAQEMNGYVSSGLKQRVCHNDCKINNCLLSEADQSFGYVVDLDTVGPGYLFYDFGDLMRTCLVKAQENEMSTQKLTINQEAFEVLAASYIAACGDTLTATESKSLVFGGLYMTYIMGIRFLADYLRGDVYYKTSFGDENLIRARNQFVILEQLMALRQDFEVKIRNYG